MGPCLFLNQSYRICLAKTQKTRNGEADLRPDLKSVPTDLCCIVLHCIVSYCGCVVVYYSVSYCIVCVLLYCVVFIVLYCILFYCILLYYVYCIASYCIALCCIDCVVSYLKLKRCYALSIRRGLSLRQPSVNPSAGGLP